MSDIEADYEKISYSDSKALQIAVKNGTKIGIVGINQAQITSFVEWIKNSLLSCVNTVQPDQPPISWDSFKESLREKLYQSLQNVSSEEIEKKCENFFADLKKQNVDALVVSVSRIMSFEDKLVSLFAQKYELPFIIVTTGMMEGGHENFEVFKKHFLQSIEPLDLEDKIFHLTQDMKRKKIIQLLQHIFEMNSSPFFDYLKHILKRLYDSFISMIYKRPTPNSEAINELIQRIIKNKKRDEEFQEGKKRLEELEAKKAIVLNSIKYVKQDQQLKIHPIIDTSKTITRVEDDEDDVRYQQQLKDIEEEAQRIKNREKEMEEIAAAEKLAREKALQERKEKMQLSKEIMEKQRQTDIQIVTSPVLENVMQQFRQDSFTDDQERLDHVKALIARSTAITLPSPSIYRQAAIDHTKEMPSMQMSNIQLPKRVENVVIQNNAKAKVGVIGLSMSGRNTLIGALAGGIRPDKISSNPFSKTSYDIYKINYPNNGVIERTIDENVKIYEEFFQTMKLQNLSALLVTVYGSLRDNDFFIISSAQRHGIPIGIVRTKLDEWLDNTHDSKECYIQKDKKFIRNSLKSEKIEKMDDLIFNISALSYIIIAEEGQQNCSMAKYLQDEPLLEEFLKNYGINWPKACDWVLLEMN